MDLNKIDKENDIVICYGVDESKDCYNAGIKRMFLSKPEIYDILDNKALCYQFVKNNTRIPIIDTFIPKDSNVDQLNNFRRQ